MSKPLPVAAARSAFEQIKRVSKNGAEHWSARDLARVLAYSEYRHFEPVLGRAREACAQSGHVLADHFEEYLGMVPLGSGAKRGVGDWKLSRYACYLVIQNADPAKPLVALGQTYFAIQTRRQELADEEQAQEDRKRLQLREEMKKHNKKLAGAAKRAGVVQPEDYAVFMDHGYRGLYGGLGMRAVQIRKGLRPAQQLLDHMGSTEPAANLFRATQAEEKLRRENVSEKSQANRVHEEVGQKVRRTIHALGGTMPEDLPSGDNIKLVARRERKREKLSE